MNVTKRHGIVSLAVLVALVAMTALLNTLRAEAQSVGTTTFRGELRVYGPLHANGPVRIDSGGSIGVYNALATPVAMIDSGGNITATGRITAAGFDSDDLVRGFADDTARLIGSLAAPTLTVTGTAVVGSLNGGIMRSGNCSLVGVPAAGAAWCALYASGGNLNVVVYTSSNGVATVGADVSWFAWLED